MPVKLNKILFTLKETMETKRFITIFILFFLSLSVYAGPHDSDKILNNSVIGTWQVLLRSVSNFSTNDSKMNSPKYEYYTFKIDGTGCLSKDNKESDFLYEFDGSTLTIKYSDNYLENYTTLLFSSGDGLKTIGLMGTFDYYDDGTSVFVSMSIMQ